VVAGVWGCVCGGGGGARSERSSPPKYTPPPPTPSNNTCAYLHGRGALILFPMRPLRAFIYMYALMH
jgi:hypothetical protein